MSKSTTDTTTQFTWSDAGELPLLVADGTTYFIYGPAGLPIEHISGATPTYYVQDQLGSTRALTNTSGTVVATATYDANGKLAATTGTLATPLRYNGQYADSESGFVYLRARYYESGSGQFLTRDPAAGVTRSAYGYGYDNPVNSRDPDGLWGIRLGPIKIGNDGCPLGTNADGSCRGSGVTSQGGELGQCVWDSVRHAFSGGCKNEFRGSVQPSPVGVDVKACDFACVEVATGPNGTKVRAGVGIAAGVTTSIGPDSDFPPCQANEFWGSLTVVSGSAQQAVDPNAPTSSEYGPWKGSFGFGPGYGPLKGFGGGFTHWQWASDGKCSC